MIKEIRARVAEAAEENSKIGVFHCEVLIHASELREYDPHAFCRDINVPDSYATEFRKILKLAKILESRNMKIN